MAKMQIDDGLLVALVHSSTALYDRTNSHYKDPVLKDQAWTTIAKTLNAPKVVCKSRWTILRQRYSRVKRQLFQSSKPGRRSTAWQLFENLNFLDDHIVPRMRFSSNRSESDAKNNASDADNTAEMEDVKPCKAGLDRQIQQECFTSTPATPVSSSATPITVPPSPISSTITTPPTPSAPSCSTGERELQDTKIKNTESETIYANMIKQRDVSFGEFISFELSSFKNEFNKDRAKQIIVNIIYRYKNEVNSIIE